MLVPIPQAIPEMICGLRTDVQAPSATLPAFLFVIIRLSLGGDQVDGCEEGAITIADDRTLPMPAGRRGLDRGATRLDPPQMGMRIG